MAVGTAPVDIIPAINHVGNPEVVDPVPIYPKFGRADAPSTELPSAAKPTFVTAAIEPLVPTYDPADNPELLSAVAAVDPVITEPATVPILPTNGASRKVKLLVADATDVTAEDALLTNHETLFVAFWVSAVIPEPAAILIELNVILVVPVNADTAARPPELRAPKLADVTPVTAAT